MKVLKERVFEFTAILEELVIFRFTHTDYTISLGDYFAEKWTSHTWKFRIHTDCPYTMIKGKTHKQRGTTALTNPALPQGQQLTKIHPPNP